MLFDGVEYIMLLRVCKIHQTDFGPQRWKWPNFTFAMINDDWVGMEVFYQSSYYHLWLTITLSYDSAGLGLAENAKNISKPKLNPDPKNFEPNSSLSYDDC